MISKHPKSRKRLSLRAQDLLAQNTNASTWIHKTWKEKWTKNLSHLHSFITDVGPIPTGHEFNQTAWVQLNHLCTGIEWLGSLMLKWELSSDNNCSCDFGAEQQTSDHILYCQSTT